MWPVEPEETPRGDGPLEERAQLRFPPPRRREAEVPEPAVLPLAQGELGEEDARELRVLKDQILRAVGFQCDSYKEKCLRRRIAVRMRARGLHTYGEYARLLHTDAAEYHRLLDTLTINVSKFYRNPEVWQQLNELVLPELYAMNSARIQVWSAGCAGGEEPYTAAMLFHDYAHAHGHDPDKHRVLGTDIDTTVMAFAERAEYSAFAMTDIPTELQARWFDIDATYRLKPEAKKHVRFQKLDLLQDPFPAKQQLIFCRNVIIYFERPLQEVLFRRFADALVPGGFLVLGKVEALFGSATSSFRTISARQRIFRKL